jgi:glycogen operon protein
LTWINANGSEMQDSDWSDGNMHCFGMLIDGRAQTTGIRQRGHEVTMLLVYNAHFDLVKFTMPEAVGGNCWSLLLDTNTPEDGDRKTFASGAVYDVTARSCLLFELKPGEEPQKKSERKRPARKKDAPKP